MPGKNKKETTTPPADHAHYHILSNRNHFYLHHAFIIFLKKEGNEFFRLVVCHNKKLLTDLAYVTLRGAKIAFAKFHQKRGFSKEVKADWREIPGNLQELNPALAEGLL